MKIALVISAHNEEVVLEQTIQSAIDQGQAREDIYVIADTSGDQTMQIAIRLLGLKNAVSTSKRSKAQAISYGVERFGIIDRYDWIHIADADGTFGDNYFSALRNKLSPRYAAATGYIRSRKGSYISAFRALEYTWGMDVIRRTQSWLGSITVIPGPSSIFRSDVFAKLDWHAPTLAEDFDVTLQIHRQNLGEIQFIPGIKAHTQDPYTFSDYVRQIGRWNKGTFQSMARHGIGKKTQMIDFYLGFQIVQGLLSFAVFALLLPIISIAFQRPHIMAYAFLYDMALTFALCVFASLRTRHANILKNFPLVYMLKWVQGWSFIRHFISTFVLRKGLGETMWSHKVARYSA